MTIKVLAEAPTLAALCDEVRQAEESRRHYAVEGYDLKLDLGVLTITGKTLSGEYRLSDEVVKNLADLVAVPSLYFAGCDPELQAITFNHRLRRVVPEKDPLQVTVQNDTIEKISKDNLLVPPRAPILDRIQETIPDKLDKGRVRAVVHESNGHFDVDAIAEELADEPKQGDAVAFGINVREDPGGAISIQSASFRLVCSNGAVRRICDGSKHRLRRPINRPDGMDHFLGQLGQMARSAWVNWRGHFTGMRELTTKQLPIVDRDALGMRLRQPPFYLPAAAVDQVVERLLPESADDRMGLSYYDVFNALSQVGTHDSEISAAHRRKFRLAAGELTRRDHQMCPTCRREMPAMPGGAPLP